MNPTKNVATTAGTVSKALKKGEHLFLEGDGSRAMYLLKSGIIRLYKKRNDSQIEIDTIRSGQILGELAFLDGNPRSASAEALTDCDLIEISGPVFQNVLGQMPEWLKLLLKTIVGRLRSASNRIRQLETSSTTFDYSDKDGARAANYTYLMPADLMRTLSTILLVCARHGKVEPQGTEVSVQQISRVAGQMLSVPSAKITSILDLLAQCEYIVSGNQSAELSVIVAQVDFLEKLLSYLCDENLLEPTKRHDLSLKGFAVMSAIAKNLSRYPVDPASGFATINLAEIKRIEKESSGKEPFHFDDFTELVALGYATGMTALSANDMVSHLKPEPFLMNFKFQKFAIAVRAMNEQKRRSGAK